MSSRNREIWEQIKAVKTKEKGLPLSNRSKVEVINKTVIIDGEPIQKQLRKLQPKDLFVDKAECEKMDKIKFAVSDTAIIEWK